MKESDLYLPLKGFLEAQNYVVKGEVGHCDLVAVRGEEPPLIVELKLSINLTVILQAVDRLSIASHVYIGVPKQSSALKRKYKSILKLLRMLGIGLMAINPNQKNNPVKVLLDPAEYKPRQSKHRLTRLLGEFHHRVGDPNLGGSDMQAGVITAYRQKAIKIALFLEKHGPTKASEIAQKTKESKARLIMFRNVYGWIDSELRGIYQLSPRGDREIQKWKSKV